MHECFRKVFEESTCDVRRCSSLLSFYIPGILRWGVSSKGAAVVRLDFFSMRNMLLFSPSRIHNRGADAIGRYFVLFNREADVIRRYHIFVKTVSLILVDDFTSTLFVGFFPSRSYCLAFDWEINAGMDIERFGIGIAVLSCLFLMMEFRTAVLPWQ